MDEGKRDLIQQWLTIARNDLDVAAFVGAQKSAFSEIAALPCQQAGEKSLKG